MNNERKLKQVHFQITRNCNLRCAFCGQWGRKGFFSDTSGEEMKLDDWKRIVAELKVYREETNISPKITIWGGEPLVSPFFDNIVSFIKHEGFITEIITNGVLIDKHKKVIEDCVDTIYISLDGPKEIHDEIRGIGVFDTVIKNIKALNHDDITVMSVITPQLLEVLPEFLEELEALKIKQLYLQDMIGLDIKEIQAYKEWIKDVFGITADNINSWRNDNLFRVEEINTKTYNYEIEHKKHNKNGNCKSPFNHVHITWNGNVMYCTDFYDFIAGNAKKDTIEKVFLNEKSEKFRREITEGKCITCNHCSWRNTSI